MPVSRAVSVSSGLRSVATEPRIYPLSRGRFWPYSANDPDQIQQAGVIPSIPYDRVVQCQKICRRLFGISFQERSYRPAKLTRFQNFLIFAILAKFGLP